MKGIKRCFGCESALRVAGLGFVILLGAFATPATAQAVYSVNVQGYVNKTIPLAGPVTFVYVANPLNGIDNRLSWVFPNLPNGTMIYMFRGNTFEVYTYFDRWLPADATLNPGEGIILALDRSTAADPTVLTFAGEVRAGPQLENILPPGPSLKASIVPRAGLITRDLGLVPRDEDMLGLFNENAQTEEGLYFYIESFWFEAEPFLRVGQSFWYFNNSSMGNSWVQSFSVSDGFSVLRAAAGAPPSPRIYGPESTRCMVGPVSVSAGRTTSSRFEISWPTEFSDFQLEQTTSLDGAWSNVTQSAEIVQNRRIVSVTNSSGMRFFRIIREPPVVLLPPVLYSKLCDPWTITLFWDRDLSGFVLESADNLSSGPWTTLGAGADTNGFRQLTVSPGVLSQFYRLRK